MSVIVENDLGWIICSETYFNKINESVTDENLLTCCLKLRKVFFDIKTPFYTDGMSEKKGREIQSRAIPKRKRNRKKKIIHPRNLIDDFESVKFIQKGFDSLIAEAKCRNYLGNSEVTPEDWFENNGKARKAASEVLNHTNTTLSQNSGLFNKNPSPCALIKKFGNDKYVLPPRSIFHLCDIASFVEGVDSKFDLILIDPPWVNRSVKRKSSYNSLKYDCLKNIPFQRLANPGCLIVVWITNSSSAASFVLEELFPKCNVFLSSMWHWCKITRKGNPVYPFDSHHKKPFENLILGRVQYDDDEDGSKIRPLQEIDSKKLIISVPSSIHSHKPPLVEILQPYVKPDALCLELFARYLLPGWTSVGNEVLKLQSIQLFETPKEAVH